MEAGAINCHRMIIINNNNHYNSNDIYIYTYVCVHLFIRLLIVPCIHVFCISLFDSNYYKYIFAGW